MLKQLVIWGLVVLVGWLWWSRRQANRKTKGSR